MYLVQVNILLVLSCSYEQPHSPGILKRIGHIPFAELNCPKFRCGQCQSEMERRRPNTVVLHNSALRCGRRRRVLCSSPTFLLAQLLSFLTKSGRFPPDSMSGKKPPSFLPETPQNPAEYGSVKTSWLGPHYDSPKPDRAASSFRRTTSEPFFGNAVLSEGQQITLHSRTYKV
jgi:hypothetical protein